jgi:hypothetical protein
MYSDKIFLFNLVRPSKYFKHFLVKQTYRFDELPCPVDRFLFDRKLSMEQAISELDALLTSLDNASKITEQRNACKNIQNWLFEERNRAALSSVSGLISIIDLMKNMIGCHSKIRTSVIQ